MRSKEELQKLLIDVKGWFKQEFNYDYDAKKIDFAIQWILQERYSQFIKKRIDHLPNKDIVGFAKIFFEDSMEPLFVPPIVAPEPVKEVVHGEVKKKVPARKS
jgi:hypothetical protein